MRYAAISNSFTHLDHLAPLCYFLDMPYVVTNPKLFEHCQKYYPQVKVVYKDFTNFTLSYLAENFDALFLSSKAWGVELSHLIQRHEKKLMRFIYCPHGNSDKIYGYEHIDQHFKHDIHLVYGQQMTDYLSHFNLLDLMNATVTVGNYRRTFYLMHQTEFDHYAQTTIFSQFAKPQKTIFYAPTWRDVENNTSFLDYQHALLKELPSHLNLIIKMHPLLEKYNPSETYYLLEKCKNLPNVVAILDIPFIYPIMNRSDAFLGDYSSVGYDFLPFKRPMFFLTQGKRETPLTQCGYLVDPAPFACIESHPENSHQDEQQKLYQYAFEQNITTEEFVKNIKHHLTPVRAI